MRVTQGLWAGLATASALLAGAGCASGSGAVPTTDAPRAGLRAFADEAQLQAHLEPLVAAWRVQEAERVRQRELREAECRAWEAANPGKTCRDREPMLLRSPGAPLSSAPAPAAAPAAPAAAASPAESITNNQVAGVDEGGIVKQHGRHLVVLRRGRLFSIDIGQAGLALSATAPAYAIGDLPVGGWYDEMLIHGSTIVVIGFSARRGGTEIGLFDIDPAGRIEHRLTQVLRSADYYSSRNYASRLVDGQLVMYAPVPLRVSPDPLAGLPTMGEWRGASGMGPLRRIAPPTRIYRTDEPVDPRLGVTLHTVLRCDLNQRHMPCEASGVLGPTGRVFFVSGQAVYVWTVQGGWTDQPARAALFRLPLDGRSLPGAIKTEGSPIDQFSFAEAGDGTLQVLLRANGRGDGMWRAEGAGGNLALLRLTARDFGDGQGQAPAAAYRALPPAGDGALQNRHVGHWLLYGATNRQVRPPSQAAAAFGSRTVVAVDTRASGAAQSIVLGHSIDRIEALGAQAIVIGSAGSDLSFTPVRLGGGEGEPVRAEAPLVERDAAQGETRSHGFFYRPDAGSSTTQGVLALPVRGPRAGATGLPGAPQWSEGPAGMVWLRVSDGPQGIGLSHLGRVEARPHATPRGVPDDACVASCVDWYGNARPIFLAQRSFALMGYELVELALPTPQAPSLRELQRLDFMPRR